MANTYTLIASNTLGSSAASVTFSSIPNTYTDLVLRITARVDSAGNSLANTSIAFYLNDTFSGDLQSYTRLDGDGATAASSRVSNGNTLIAGAATSPSGATANTFGNLEIYLPNYATSNNKPISTFGVTENNSATAYISAVANLFRSSSVINKIQMVGNLGGNFVSGSSFFLYGIKNS